MSYVLEPLIGADMVSVIRDCIPPRPSVPIFELFHCAFEDVPLKYNVQYNDYDKYIAVSIHDDDEWEEIMNKQVVFYSVVKTTARYAFQWEEDEIMREWNELFETNGDWKCELPMYFFDNFWHDHYIMMPC